MEWLRHSRALAGRRRPDPGAGVPRSLHEQLTAINALEPDYRSASDEALGAAAETFRTALPNGASTDATVAPFFALAREVSRRTIGQRPFDVQILGSLGLLGRTVVQMQTGEGKTLMAVAPVALNALRGRGVHVLTFNDYLARRDAEWMGPIYRALGLSVAFVQGGMSATERRAAYSADVTYITAKEAGFDYLRDGLIRKPAAAVHRGLSIALVDEADSILIDEARVPLVIAGGGYAAPMQPERLAAVVAELDPIQHWRVDPMRRTVHLTDAGIDRAEELLGSGPLHTMENAELLSQLNVALYAVAIMQRDVDYIVRDGRVGIVDELTGRVVKDRHWPDGLQAAVEAKERVERSPEGRVLGQIPLQYFVQEYSHLCGMTATAKDSAAEFRWVYNLEVLVIPSHQPCIRIDHPDRVFTHAGAKVAAVSAEIAEVHGTGRPILVGTASVAESDQLAARLHTAGIRCAVLNARRDDEEARIVAQAGEIGAVTISTNMAGRGVDIRLGGPEEIERERVAGLGGLYVIGTNRHESVRVDNQLRGRAGRQGDPGSSRFFVSLEDPLLSSHGLKDLIPARRRPALRADAVDDPALRHAITVAQRIVDGRNFDIRNELRRYSAIIEAQRRVFQEHRGRVLTGAAPSIWPAAAPETYGRLIRGLGEAAAAELERLLTLTALDDAWTEHLSAMEDVREEIHLAAVGGLSPLDEYRKVAIRSFEVHCGYSSEDGRLHLDDRIVASLNNLPRDLSQVDGIAAGLLGPSSTWSYVLQTDLARDPLAAWLAPGQTGLAAAAAGTGPLMWLWTVATWLANRRARK